MTDDLEQRYQREHAYWWGQATRPRPTTDFSWAMFHLSQGRKVRRWCWPVGWHIWRAFPNVDQRYDTIICGWGNEIGADDAQCIEGLGTNGHGWKARTNDMDATDWELL